jgi:sugar (pentulose or hexulose) kinase
VLLGLDLGTTNIKALLVKDDGTVVAQGSEPVSLMHTSDGGVEQDIDQIWQATLKAICKAGGKVDLAAVRSIGVSSQGAALQIRSQDGGCIGPVVSWMDPRGLPFDTKFQERLGEDWFAGRVGHAQSSMAVGQVLRLRQANPAILDSPKVLGFVGDTIVQRFCGRAAHDGSSLSICGLYNPRLQQADPDLLEELNLSPEQLPDLISAREPAGMLNDEVAGQTHLLAGIPVGPAIHDQYAALLGCGAIDSGDVMLGAGTAWAILAVVDHLPELVAPIAWICNHIVPQRWGQLLSLVVGGSAFKWALDMTDLSDASGERIDEIIDSVPPGCDGFRLWPFLDGVGGRNRPVGGRMYGLKLGHGRGHLLRATVEGLCFELTRQLGWLEKGGCPIDRLIMCGGGAKSRCTPQIVADITGRPVTCPDQAEISAFGAAILARAMLEPDMPLKELFNSMAGTSRQIRPSESASVYPSWVQAYIETVDAAVAE